MDPQNLPPPAPVSAPAPAASYKQTSALAITSLIAGILGWTLLPWLGSLVAVITGHMARAEIRRKSGLPNDSGPAAKYRHEPRQDRFSMEAALKEQRLRAAWREVEIRKRHRHN